MPDELPTFACDAMLGGLARWLRAAGYDASWRADIDDWELVRQAQREGRILLSCDAGIFRIGIIRDGETPAFFLPAGLRKRAQLRQVLRHFHLPLRPPRCMACGGALAEVKKQEVQDRVPRRTLDWQQRYWQCERCGQPFWQGTHWPKILQLLEQEAWLG